MNSSTLGAILMSFFNNYLRLQRGLRPNTISSYADAMRLLLQFAARIRKKKVIHLGLDDFDTGIVYQFLNSLEEGRRNAIQSRNQRLAVIRAFFAYVGQQCPERVEQARKIATIPRKRTAPPETIFMERDEIEETLSRLPTCGRHALRDRTLLVFLYNTGARVQEAADVCANNVQFNPNPRVHLHGKGEKWRICPLWEETTALLRGLIDQHAASGAPDRPVFTNATGAALTRFGIYKIIRRHTQQIVKKRSDGRTKLISPHVWRHSTAVHLLEAGVEVNVIRAWLGHASLETTNRYAEITLRTKKAALEKCALPTVTDERIPRRPSWHTDASLLDWLKSL